MTQGRSHFWCYVPRPPYPLAIPNEDAATGRRRDGAARARLQSYACHEHHGCPAAYGGDESIAVQDMPPPAAAEPPKTARAFYTAKTQSRHSRPSKGCWAMR